MARQAARGRTPGATLRRSGGRHVRAQQQRALSRTRRPGKVARPNAGNDSAAHQRLSVEVVSRRDASQKPILSLAVASTALPDRRPRPNAWALIEEVGKTAATLLRLTQFASQCGGSRAMIATVVTGCDDAVADIQSLRNSLAEAVGWQTRHATQETRRTDPHGKEPQRSGVGRK